MMVARVAKGFGTASSTAPLSLRRAILADAVVSGAAGLAMALGANPLGELFELSPTLLRGAGLSVLPYAAVLTYVGTRERIARRATWAIIGTNLLWVIGSVLLLVTGWVEPTALGYAFVTGQALAVALFAELQYLALRATEPVLGERAMVMRSDEAPAP